MGTTLTGTTPQDTYDSLIKVTDNGPLSSTAKYLSDGLGNDSKLALSTGNIGIGTTTPTAFANYTVLSVNNATQGGIVELQSNGTSALRIAASTTDSALWEARNVPVLFASNNTERLRITAGGNVGIGTSSPAFKLDVGGDSPVVAINRASGNQPKLAFALSGTEYGSIVSSGATGENRFSIGPSIGWGGYHTFYTNTFERFRITDNGVTFNGDTAAANALDDYEEGTFTPSVAFGGGSTGITYFDRIGNYTKIGRQVTCTIYVAMTAIGSSTGAATLTGLPFTASGLNRGIATAASIRFDNITYTGTLSLLGGQSGNTLAFGQTTEAGVDSLLTNANFNGDSEMVITVTYFV